MSERVPVSSFQVGAGSKTPRWARNVFVGGLVGLVVALVVLFMLALSYGESMGLSGARELKVAALLTLFLSQPTSIIGMLTGAVAGAVVGSIAHLLHPH